MENRADYAMKTVFECEVCNERKPMLVGDRHDVVFMDCDECAEQRQFNQVEATVTELAVLEIQQVLLDVRDDPEVDNLELAFALQRNARQMMC